MNMKQFYLGFLFNYTKNVFASTPQFVTVQTYLSLAWIFVVIF